MQKACLESLNSGPWPKIPLFYLVHEVWLYWNVGSLYPTPFEGEYSFINGDVGFGLFNHAFIAISFGDKDELFQLIFNGKK